MNGTIVNITVEQIDEDNQTKINVEARFPIYEFSRTNPLVRLRKIRHSQGLYFLFRVSQLT